MPGGNRTRGCRTAAQRTNHLTTLHLSMSYAAPSSRKTDDGKPMKIIYTPTVAGVPAAGEAVDHGSDEEDHQ